LFLISKIQYEKASRSSVVSAFQLYWRINTFISWNRHIRRSASNDMCCLVVTKTQGGLMVY